MATFKPGQRVRIRFCYNAHLFGDFAGREGTIIDLCHTGWAVDIDGEGLYRHGIFDEHPHWFGEEQLEPPQDKKQRSDIKEAETA